MALQQFRIFAEKKGIMPLFNREPHLIERIFEGDDQAFSSLYEKYRDKFFGFFRSRCSEQIVANHVMYRFQESGDYLDDLYQNSCIKLYDQIMTGKMFVDSGKIFIKSKDGGINQLKASLETYLTSIGKLTLLEMERGERIYVDFDPIERITQDNDTPQDEMEMLFKPVVSGVSIDPIIELSTDQELNNEAVFALVRKIVEIMGPPCKEIFTYTYFNETGKKLKGEEIAKLMGYSSADVVKNQRVRCNKKFKVAFEQELAGI